MAFSIKCRLDLFEYSLLDKKILIIQGYFAGCNFSVPFTCFDLPVLKCAEGINPTALKSVQPS